MLAVVMAVLSIQGGPPEKIGICHRTGSDTNPYVFLNLPEPAVSAHLHHNGDVISTDGQCPTLETPEQPCPPPPEVEVPVLVPIPKPVAVPTPVVQVVTVPQVPQPRAVVITPPKRRLKCRRVTKADGSVSFVCDIIKPNTKPRTTG